MPTDVMSNNPVSCTSDGPGHLYSYGNPTRVPQDATTRLASVTNVGDGWQTRRTGRGAVTVVASRRPQISTAAAGQAGWLRVDPSGAGVLLVAEPDRMEETPGCWPHPTRWSAAGGHLTDGWVWVVVGMLAVGLPVSWAAVDGSPDTSRACSPCCWPGSSRRWGGWLPGWAARSSGRCLLGGVRRGCLPVVHRNVGRAVGGRAAVLPTAVRRPGGCSVRHVRLPVTR